MVNPKILDYIRNTREKDGLLDEVIKKNLRFVGWSDEEIEESFRAADIDKEKKPAMGFPEEKRPSVELQEEEKPGEEFLREEGFIEKPKKLQFNKKYLMPLIILVVFISLASASILVYDKFFRKIDPISLLPQETAFYLRVKINPEDGQVKNLKELLNRFPYYEKFSQKISEGFEEAKEQYPPLKSLDFTISDEIILAWISPFEKIEEETMRGELPLILILPDPDLKKLKKLSDDVKKSIEESKDWKLETEVYRGRTIVKAYSPTLKVDPTFKPSFTLTDGHFVLTTESNDIKKIIDVIENQKITSVFKRNKIKNINSNIAYKKIRKYLPKNYLAIFYGQFDFSKILQTPGIIGTIAKSEDFLGPFTASLEAALDLPFFIKKESEESEKIAVAWAIIADKNELKTEGYSLDLREDVFEPSPFSFEDSLANFVPEKIDNREIAYYSEGRNLKSAFEYLEETLTKQMTAEERKEFDEFLKTFEEVIGINLKEDIIFLFEKNYAFFLASESTGKETPTLAFIFEVENEQKAKENLLKISIPPIPLIPLTSPFLPSLSPEQIPQEKITFSKEIVDGLEVYSLSVYSLPVLGEFGLNFSIKDKKLIFTLTKEGLINILKSLSDPNQKKLKDLRLFAEQFNKVPKKITSIEYNYPYGYSGAIKWGTSFILNIFLQRIAIPIGVGAEDFEVEKPTAVISEFLDKGVSPYLKVLKSAGSYSYSLEEGLTISKGKLVIEELPAGEKRATEEFLENLPQWFQENLGPIFGPVYAPPIEPIPIEPIY